MRREGSEGSGQSDGETKLGFLYDLHVHGVQRVEQDGQTADMLQTPSLRIMTLYLTHKQAEWIINLVVTYVGATSI